MRPIQISCNSLSFFVIGNYLNEGHDFVIKSNSHNKNFDYFIFLDSRGVSSDFSTSLAQKIIHEMERKKSSYLIICRPIELTTWSTLINFLSINQLSPTKIITNMGFVDFTPKKLSLLDDAIKQARYLMGEKIVQPTFVENFLSSTGDLISLYSMDYSYEYKKNIEVLTEKFEILLINTPLVDSLVNFTRSRPSSFYDGLINTNKFNRSIENIKIIDLPNFDTKLTYDAVHYTSSGSDLIFDKIKKYL